MIKVSQSDVGLREIVRIARVVSRGYLGMGNEVSKFEKDLSNLMGGDVCVTATGTSALHLALQAAGVGPGDEVLVPSLTYVATFQSITATGATAVACDISETTLNICLTSAKKNMSDKTRAILPVYFAGELQHRSQVRNFAKTYNLRVVEDMAHSFLSLEIESASYPKPIDFMCFSFDGIKNITSGEGGMVMGPSKDLNRIRDLRLLGVIGDSDRRAKGLRSYSFDVREQGWRYHMSDVHAAIGRAQIRKSRRFASKRRSIAKFYDQEFMSADVGLTIPRRNYDLTVPHIYPVILPTNIDRDALRSDLETKGIGTAINYLPNHQLSFFKSTNNGPLPVVTSIASRILSLPMHTKLSRRDIELVAKTVIRLLS